jgi:sulfonate transport system substrate-binding protein
MSMHANFISGTRSHPEGDIMSACNAISRRKALQLAGAGALSLALPMRRAFGRAADALRITYQRNNGVTYMALERGDFAKRLARRGFGTERVGPFPNHAPALQAVVGGSADMGFGGSCSVGLASIIAGSPLVFALFGESLPRTTMIISKDPAIRTVPDLIGKTVAGNRSGLGELVTVGALEKHGIDRSRIKFLYMNPPDGALALSSGKVDAWAMWSPVVNITLEREKDAHVIFAESDLDIQLDYSGYLCTREFAENNVKLLRAFIETTREEVEWYNTHPRDVETLGRELGGYSEQLLDYFIKLNRRLTLREVNDEEFLERFQKTADWLSDHQVLPKKVRVRDHLAKL